MLKWLEIIVRTIVSTLCTQRSLAIENLVLRQQLAVLKHRHPRPRLTDTDRFFWVVLSRIWAGWRESLHIVQPETVVRWHRQGFRYYWRWKSRRRGPPSQTWRTFLANHAKDTIALDFFTLPTATFRILFVLLILSHDRRRILHLNVTEHPSAAWTAQQLLEACGLDEEPRYLLRDRDAIYGLDFRRQAAVLDIKEVVTAARSPWQNPYAERVIGSIRRECLDHIIILNERHLKRVLSSYVTYYHGARTHLSLAKDAPPIKKRRWNTLPHTGLKLSQSLATRIQLLKRQILQRRLSRPVNTMHIRQLSINK